MSDQQQALPLCRTGQRPLGPEAEQSHLPSAVDAVHRWHGRLRHRRSPAGGGERSWGTEPFLEASDETEALTPVQDFVAYGSETGHPCDHISCPGGRPAQTARPHWRGLSVRFPYAARVHGRWWVSAGLRGLPQRGRPALQPGSAALASVTVVSSARLHSAREPTGPGLVRDVRQRYRQRQYGRGMSQHLEVTLASLNSHGGRGADGIPFDLAAAGRCCHPSARTTCRSEHACGWRSRGAVRKVPDRVRPCGGASPR